MDTERNWGAESWREPTLGPDDRSVFSEHGRCIYLKEHRNGGGTDYRSHWFRLVVGEHRTYYLLVKHGGGQERIQLQGAWMTAPVAKAMEGMTADERYLLLHLLYSTHSDARRAGRDSMSLEYRQAFVDGRLKKRKNRGADTVKVWIEPPTTKVKATTKETA